MKRIYLILGDGSVGKSSLIRSLTGIRAASSVVLRLTSGVDINIWVWLRSAQEQPMSPNEMMQQILHEHPGNPNYYLIPLRINGNNECPGYIEYIDILIKNSCIIMNTALLTNNLTPPTISTIITPEIIINSKENPINVNANRVRSVWGWV